MQSFYDLVETTLRVNNLTPSPSVVKQIADKILVAHRGEARLDVAKEISRHFPFADSERIASAITDSIISRYGRGAH